MSTRLCLPYATVDVFTDTALAGNQLGIVLLDKNNSKTLTQEQKHAITREFNYSETVFMHPFDFETHSRRVDIWTPSSEIPFAGHPTIGSVHYIISNLSPEKDDREAKCVLQLKAGKVIGYLDQNTNYARAEIPQDVHINSVDVTWNNIIAIQPALGNGQVSVVMQKKQHKAVSIVKGMTFVLIDLSAQPDLLAKVEIAQQNVMESKHMDAGWNDGLVGTLFFVKREDQGDGVTRINQRVIVIGLEDPATGSASAALGAFLALGDAVKGRLHKFELEQGTQMGRKSIIGCDVTLNESCTGVDKIVLSGQVVQVMKGELSL